jgi:fatty-acyl-CoA synthase
VVLDARRDPDRIATVGRPGRGVEVSIRDDQGRPVAQGSVGQVLLRGPQLCSGYYGRPELDAERFVDGWLATGDYASEDPDGFLTLLGRRDDMVTCGGHHFFPAEAETDLGPVDGVVDYVFVGVPDPVGLLGEVPWAFVLPADRGCFEPQAFLRRARERLPPHMRPRKIVVVSELARTLSGKPDRRKTVAAYGPR